METLEPKSDAELLRLSLSGDENSFRLLYERLKQSIFRYAFYMTSSRSAAEEVTQEVFMMLLKDGERFDPARGDLAAFAFGIARNLVKRLERRERTHKPLSFEEVPKALSESLLSHEQLSSSMIRNELVEAVRAAVAALPEHYRRVVVLCDLCELSYEETASRLGCAIGTVRSRLNRGHALLAQKLKLRPESPVKIKTTGAEGCVI